MSTRLTASQIDRAHACPASFALPSVEHQTNRDAERGTAIHHFLEIAATQGREIALAEIPLDAPWRTTCERINIDEIITGAVSVECEVTFTYNTLSGKSRTLRNEQKRNYSAIGEGEIAGTADLVITRDDGMTVVADYKTGRYGIHVDESGQVQLLGLAVARARGLSQLCVSIINVSEDGSLNFDEMLLQKEDLERIERRVRATFERVLKAREQVAHGRQPDVTVGDHCAFCPAFRSCPANVSLARGLLTSDGMAETISELSPAQAGILWDRMVRSRQMLEEIEKGLKAYIDHTPVPLPETGREVARVEIVRENIMGRAAVPVLQECLGPLADEVIEPSVSKGALENLLRSMSTSRQEARAVMDGLLSGLRKAGAIRETVIVSYRARGIQRHPGKALPGK